MSGPHQSSTPNYKYKPDQHGDRGDGSLMPQSYNLPVGNMGMPGPPGVFVPQTGQWNAPAAPPLGFIPYPQSGYSIQPNRICNCGTVGPHVHVDENLYSQQQNMQWNQSQQPPPSQDPNAAFRQSGFIHPDYQNQQPSTPYTQQQPMQTYAGPAPAGHQQSMLMYTDPATPCVTYPSVSPEYQNQSGNCGGCTVVTEHETNHGLAGDNHAASRNNQQGQNQPQVFYPPDKIPEMNMESQSNNTQQHQITSITSAGPVQAVQSPQPSTLSVPNTTQPQGQRMSNSRGGHLTDSSRHTTGGFGGRGPAPWISESPAPALVSGNEKGSPWATQESVEVKVKDNADVDHLERIMQNMNIRDTGEDRPDKSDQVSKSSIQTGKQERHEDPARRNNKESVSVVLGATKETVDLPEADGRQQSGDRVDSEQSKTVEFERFVLMVSGLNPETRKEDLENYLESVTDYEVTQIKYTKDQCKAVVTFGEELDLEKIKIALMKRKRKLGSRIPEVSPLEVPLSIAVVGFDKRTSSSQISNYFSGRASGNNRMVRPEKIKFGPENEYVVVSFTDRTVVKQILSKDGHTLGGKDIRMLEYYREVGSPVCATSCEDEEKHENVGDLQLAEMRLLRIIGFVEDCKAEFKHLRLTTDNKSLVVFQGPMLDVEAAVKKLGSLRAEMDKHKSTMRGISRERIELLLKQEIEEYIVGKLEKDKIQGAWECDEQRFVVQVLAMSGSDQRNTADVLDKSVVEKGVDAYDLSNTEYDLFESKMKGMYPKKIFLLNNQGDSVMVVATDADIRILQNAAKEILNRIQKKSAEQKMPEMTNKSSSVRKMPGKHHDDEPKENAEFHHEDVLPLHPVAARFLHKHMQDEVKKICSECCVETDFVTSDQTFVIKGSPESVEKAIKQLEVLSKRIKTKCMTVKGQHVLRLQCDGLVQSLVELAEKSYRCTVEHTVLTKAEEEWHTFGGRTVHVVQGNNLKHNVKATMLLIDTIYQPFDEFSAKMLTEGGSTMKYEIQQIKSKRAVLDIGATITVKSDSDFTDMFILTCVTGKIDDATNHLAKAVHSFLDNSDQKECCSIALPVNDLHLGMLDSWTVSKVVAKTLKVHFDQYQDSKVRYIYLLSVKDDSFVSCLTHSKIYLPIQAGPQRARGRSRKNRVFSKGVSKIEIKVIEGELTKQKVDVIVNTVDAKLDLNNGVISRTILAAGGHKLQQICRDKYANGLHSGEVAVTPATGKLKDHCQKVYHCCLPSRSDPKSSLIISKMLKEILQQVSQDKLSTIAFPALGTGNHGYSASLVARWMFEAVRIHQKTVPDSTLQEVFMVIYYKNKDVFKVFKEKADAYNNPSEWSHEHRNEPEPSGTTAACNPSSPSYAAVAAASRPNHAKSKIEIDLKYGAIADEAADVIVNTARNDMNLNYGNVSKTILRQGGHEIQNDLYKRCGSSKPFIPDGNYVFSIGGKLNCRYIYHICLPSWKSSSSFDFKKKQLHSLLMKCLRDASHCHCKSIAFPALGTGMLEYPHDVVAREMYAAVTELSKDDDCQLEKVIFVVYGEDQKSIDAFNAEDAKFRAKYPSASGQSTSQKSYGNTRHQPTGYGWDKKYQLEMYSVHLTIHQGDLTKEKSVGIVVPVSPSMDFTTGIITCKLKTHKNGQSLEAACYTRRDELAKNHIVSVHGFGTCRAEKIIFVNRDTLKSNEQMVLEQCLKRAEDEGMCSITFPMLQSSGTHVTDAEKMAKAEEMAKDLYEALKSFAPTSKRIVKDVKVTIYDHKMLEPFGKRMGDLMNSPGHSQGRSSRGGGSSSSHASGHHTRYDKPPTLQHLVHPQSTAKPDSDHSPKPKLIFHIASELDHTLTSVYKTLQALCSESETISENFKDDRFKDIDDSKEQKIASLSQRFEVDINMFSRKCGTIWLKGQSVGVCQAIKEILHILASVQQPSPGVNMDNQEQPSSKNTWKFTMYDSGNGGKDFGQSNTGYAGQGSSYAGSGKKSTVAERIEMTGQHGSQQSSGNFNQQTTEISKETINRFYSEGDKPEDVPDDDLFVPGNNGNTRNTEEGEEHEHVYNTTDEQAMDDQPSEAGATGGDLSVEWFLVDDTDDGKALQSYEDMISQIEMAYQKNEREVVLPGEDTVYVIDFATMEEYVKGSEEDRVPVIRREKITGDYEVPLPPEVSYTGSDGVKVVMVDRASQDFSDVKELFTKASKDAPVSLVKIEKMSNIKLHQSYEIKKDNMKRLREGSSDTDLECRLWHGPLGNTDTIVNLSKFGFNRSYCRSGEERDLGDGIYFYPNIEPILKNSQVDASGHHHVCLSRVLTGKKTVGRQGLRDAPWSSDSVVDIDSLPTKFAIFFDNQALPEYLVTFTVSETK